jgi:two-component system sensor histidine kinase YesM
MESGGLLSIKGWKADGGLCLEIKDNGKGMDPEEQKRAMTGDLKRIGLSNAVQRLGLIYGEHGRIGIDSEPGRGTRIVVSVPLRSGNQ